MSLLDQRDVLAGLKAPTSLSTIGKSYDVAAGGAGASGAGQRRGAPEVVSTIASQQNKASAKDTRADRWDSAELVEAVIEEAEQARRQRQLEKTLKSRNRTTLVERERQRNRERTDARLANASTATALEGVGIASIAGGGGGTAPAAAAGKAAGQQPSAAAIAVGNTSNAAANNSNATTAGRSANSFAQVTANPMQQLMRLNLTGLDAAGTDGTAKAGGTAASPTAAGADQQTAAGRRGVTVISSPRQNPLLTAKLQSELGAGKLDAFLQSTANAMPRLDDLVSRNLSMGTTRRLRREAMLARQQRRLLRGGGGGGDGDEHGGGGANTSDEEEEGRRLKEGGVAVIGVRGAMNRQREAVYGKNGSALDASRPVSPDRGNNTTVGAAAAGSDEQSTMASFRSNSPPASNGLKVPEALRATAAEAQEAQRIANHAQGRRPGSPTAAAAAATNVDSTGLSNVSGAIAGATNGNAPPAAPPIALPSNATFLNIAAKASVKDAIVAAEAEDRRLKTSAIISTSTDRHGNVVKLDGLMLLDAGTTAVTAESIATAAKMAKVGAADKGGAATKGFFGRSASPLQLLAIPDGTPVESVTTYKPGAALATLVDTKSRLTRSHFIESRRETSSFNAPARQPLLVATAAPLHASYHIRYTTVERQPPSAAFSSMDHHAFNTHARSKEAKEALRRQREDESYALSSTAANLSAINASSTAGGGGRSSSPQQQQQGQDPSSTFFNLTQAKLGETTGNASDGGGGGYDSMSSEGESDGLGGTSRFRRKRNDELIPTGNRPEVRQEAIFKMNNTTVPDQSILAAPTDAKDFRLHDVRDTSSAFKTGGRSFPMANLQDLYYYPLQEPGLSNYGGGKIVGNAREREWNPLGKPCGAPTTYNLDLIDERHRQEQRERQTPAFGKIVGRSEQKHPFVQASIPSVDTSQFSYKDQRDNVGKRPNVYVTMHKQTSRPPTKLASKTEAPHMNTNSIVSVPKRGFVDLGRMTNYETRDPDYFAIKRANDTTTPLFINPDSVLYTHPAFSFNKGSVRFGGPSGDQQQRAAAEHSLRQQQRSHSSMSIPRRKDGDDFISASSLPRRPMSTEPTDYGYADDSPVRRRAPAVAFPLTDRETRPILRVPAPGDYTKGVSAQVFPAKDATYDTESFVKAHVPAANFAPLVSREQREKSLQQRFASTDAVYDIPRSDKAKLVLPFSKSTGRASK